MIEKEQFEFTMNTIVIGVMTVLNNAVAEGKLTEAEAQAGAERVFSNLSEMLTLNWCDAFNNFLDKIQKEVDDGEKNPSEPGIRTEGT